MALSAIEMIERLARLGSAPASRCISGKTIHGRAATRLWSNHDGAGKPELIPRYPLGIVRINASIFTAPFVLHDVIAPLVKQNPVL